MISKYVEAIYFKNRFNLAVDIIDKKQIFIDAEIQHLNAHQLKDDWYYGLQFFKGMSCYNLKDYKTAERIFKKLTEYDGQNERFKLWLEHAKYGLRSRMVTMATFVCLGVGATEMIFKSQIPNYYVRQSMLIVAACGMFASLGYEAYIKRKLREAKGR